VSSCLGCGGNFITNVCGFRDCEACTNGGAKAATERVKKKMSGCKLLTGMAGHTGQSSQLFPVATDRNAQFLATVERRLISKSDLDLPGMQASATVQSRALLTCGRLRVRASEPFLSAGGSGNDTRACARCIVAAGPNVHSRSGSCSFDNRNSIERPCPGVREINPSFSSVRPSDGPTAP
jgi:hypothetical protein